MTIRDVFGTLFWCFTCFVVGLALFKEGSEVDSPIEYQLGGIVLMAFGVLLFYFSFIHGFFQRESEGSRESGSVGVPSASRGGAYSLTLGSTPFSIGIRKNKASIRGLARIINGCIGKLNFKLYNKNEKYKLEAIFWLFCVSHSMIRDVYAEAAKNQNRFYSNLMHVDHVRLRSVSIACIAILQHLGVSSLSVRELSRLYWDRFSIYSEMKKENHFIALFSLLLNEDEGRIQDINYGVDTEKRVGGTNKITISTINKHSLSLCNSLVSDILKWMLSFFQTKRFIELYDYSVALFEDHAQWTAGLKDKYDGRIYACCNGCSVLHEINRLDDLDCPDCRARLRKCREEQAKQDDLSSIKFKFSVFCRCCGHEFRVHNSDIHRHGLCRTCFDQFSKNFASLRKRFGIKK